MLSTAAGKESLSQLSQKRLKGGLKLRSSVAKRVKTVFEGINKEVRKNIMPSVESRRETNLSITFDVPS